MRIILRSSQSDGKSAVAKANRMRRINTFRMTNGRCFYCGGPVHHKGFVDKRDWLFVRPVRYRMVQEHMIPTSRGGSDHRSNYVPACAACNHEKGSFTLKEFRFVRGMRTGNLSLRFAYESGDEMRRDWLCVHSPSFERSLVILNMPSAADGYELRQRTGELQKQPRVRPVMV